MSIHKNYVDFISFFVLKQGILKIIQSNKPEIIQTYLEDYSILLQNKINQYTIELMAQSSSSSCPVSFYSCLEIIDQKLKEFVRLHHFYLIRQINYYVNKLKDNIREKQLFEQLSSYTLKNEQVIIIHTFDIFAFVSYYLEVYVLHVL